MKQLFLIGLLLSGLAFAGVAGIVKTVVRDASATNIPTAYTHGDAAFITAADAKDATHIAVINQTATGILVCINEAVPASCTDDLSVIPSGAVAFDGINPRGGVYVKSVSGAIAAGEVVVSVW